jgi:hypothetical protein
VKLKEIVQIIGLLFPFSSCNASYIVANAAAVGLDPVFQLRNSEKYLNVSGIMRYRLYFILSLLPEHLNFSTLARYDLN